MIQKISKEDFTKMVYKNHYSKVLPKLTKLYLGSIELRAVVSLGWGVRPLHTIRKLFPSLTSKDYYEIGKLCLADESPKNSESKFISQIIKWLKINKPEIKVLYTWADGMLGKPGYIYQASNFLYGGYIWTDTYVTDKGEKIHPRTAQGIMNIKEGYNKNLDCGRRPNKEFMIKNNWKQYKGKQFRYVYFLCSKKEKKRLLNESLINWNIKYPKDLDLKWKIKQNNEWIDIDNLDYNPKANSFSKNAQITKYISMQESLFNDFK